MEEKTLLRDANLEIIPQQYYDGESQTYKVVANGDTSGVDFSEKSLLRDANLEVIPQQYYDVGLGKFVIGTLLTGGGSGGAATQGPAGPAGADGEDGKSAYQSALDNGFVGTEQQWLESLVGPQGPEGLPGKDGESFTFDDFTPEQLEALRGPEGQPGKDGNDATLILPLSADDVADTTGRVLVSPQQRGQIDANTSDIASHSQRISTLEQNVGNATSTDEKVKLNSNDNSGYLEDKLDNVTIQNIDNKIVATGLNGLTSTIYELNLLTGATANIQEQINSLMHVGNFSTSVNTYADLANLTPAMSDMVIVISDETQTNSPTSIYIYNGTTWVYTGKFEGGQIRDFTTNPINLENETTGILPKSKYEKQSAAETPFTDSTGNIQATDTQEALKELFRYADNIKSSWASVVGLSLNNKNTAQEFADATYQLNVKLANNLLQKGVNAHPSNRLEEMIDKVPSISNVSLAGTVKKISKLNVTAPYELKIPLDEPLQLSDISTTPFEFMPGETGAVHYSMGFDNGDASSFEPNNLVIFDGVMKLRTEYELPMSKDDAWAGTGNVYKAEINKGDWLSINRLNVAGG